MRHLIGGLAVGFATLSVAACGGAPASVAPVSPTSTATSPTAAPTSTPSKPTSDFAGIWATPPLDWEDWEAAIETAGLDPAGAEDLIVPREWFVDYVQFEFEVTDEEWLVYQINDGNNFGVVLPGRYSMSDADTFVVQPEDADCDVTLDLSLEDGDLTVDVADVAGDDCSENYDIRVQTAVYESAPFQLVEPAGGYTVPDAPSPSPQPSDPGATPVVSTSGDRYVLNPVGTVEGAALGYTEYLPPDYEAEGSSPLIVFLHGSGESGRGNEVSLQVLSQSGLDLPITNNRWPDERPFVVLSPQHRDVDPYLCFTVTEIKDFLAFAMSRYDVDPARIYLTGLSCGAIGLWNYLATHNNEVVAAAVPIAGFGYAAVDVQGCDVGQLPIWAFHGTDDDSVYLRGSTYPMSYLADCTGPVPVDARLTVFQDAGHDVWTRVYNGSAGYDIFNWMLSHTK